MNGNYTILHTKDVSQILNMSERTALRCLNNIRKECGRIKGRFVTMSEFCHYFNMTEADVLKAWGKSDAKK